MDKQYGRPAEGGRPPRPPGSYPTGPQQRQSPQQGRPAYPQQQPPVRPVSLSASGSGQRQAPGTPQQPRRGQQPPPKKQKQKGSRWFRAIIMVLCTVGLCGFLAIFILRSANDLFGLNQPDQDIDVNIPENATVQQIASILAEAGVIDQQITFRLYAAMKDDEKYHAGEYVFNSNMGFDEILRELRTENNQKETVMVTFVEGKNIYEVAQQLEEKKVCKADAFLDHLENGDFGYEFMDQLPDNALRFRRFEGYLFPDTYEFYVGENVDSVARKFFNNFSKKITTQMSNRMRDLNLTLDETITLASIIQKEAGGAVIDEMKRVSSVFHNRLNYMEIYPKLQSDVTREYVNRFIIPFQQLRNQEMYDAYNTYAGDGLPVGPIANPGIDAINAALYPEDTQYYFFVTDVQERFYYAQTANDHYANIVTASKVEGEGEIHGTDTE